MLSVTFLWLLQKKSLLSSLFKSLYDTTDPQPKFRTVFYNRQSYYHVRYLSHLALGSSNQDPLYFKGHHFGTKTSQSTLDSSTPLISGSSILDPDRLSFCTIYTCLIDETQKPDIVVSTRLLLYWWQGQVLMKYITHTQTFFSKNSIKCFKDDFNVCTCFILHQGLSMKHFANITPALELADKNLLTLNHSFNIMLSVVMPSAFILNVMAPD